MTEKKQIVKSVLQQMLEREGWKFITNLEVYTFNNDYVPHLQRQYGPQNVTVRDAYDIFGNRIKDIRAVYVKETAIDDQKDRETEMLDLTNQKLAEALGEDKKWEYLLRTILREAKQSKKGE